MGHASVDALSRADHLSRQACYCSDMSNRDVERSVNQQQFITTLRRLADALEAGESFRIQVMDKRFTVPADAQLSIEHEVEGTQEELELQLSWVTSSVS